MQTKICTKCGIEKDIINFYNDKQKLDGKTSWCKLCLSNKHKEHYIQNKEQTIAYSVNYRLLHKEKCKKNCSILLY